MICYSMDESSAVYAAEGTAAAVARAVAWSSEAGSAGVAASLIAPAWPMVVGADAVAPLAG